MGPRSIDRGNRRQYLHPPHGLLASMGPRSIDRGNIFESQAVEQIQGLASMGPRSIDRGNKVTESWLESSSRSLQWGRDQLIAEIASTRREGFRCSRRFNGAAIN